MTKKKVKDFTIWGLHHKKDWNKGLLKVYEQTKLEEFDKDLK